MTADLLLETVWYDQWRCNDAERDHYTRLSGGVPQSSGAGVSATAQRDISTPSIVDQIAQARKQIQKSLQSNTSGKPTSAGPPCTQIAARIQSLENENKELRKVTQDLQALVKKLDCRVSALEGGSGSSAAPQAEVAAAAAEDSDDFELFGDDDDAEEVDAAAEKLKQERVAAYQAKLATKKVIIAKSNIILDVKPWDDETDMIALEKNVRSIEMDGLLWGASKLVPLAYGIKKLQISCVVEDDKVSTDDLEDKITAFEDFIQSMDIAAFNKV